MVKRNRNRDLNGQLREGSLNLLWKKINIYKLYSFQIWDRKQQQAQGVENWKSFKSPTKLYQLHH